MNRKDKTVKQLQAECRKRTIGFMMNWTKIALTKRLEDEDRKDKELLEAENVKKEQEEEINRLKAAIKSGIKKAEDKKDSQILELKKEMSNLPSMEKQMDDLKLRKTNQKIRLQRKFDDLVDEQNSLFEKTNALAKRKKELKLKIQTLEEVVTSLK